MLRPRHSPLVTSNPLSLLCSNLSNPPETSLPGEHHHQISRTQVSHRAGEVGELCLVIPNITVHLETNPWAVQAPVTQIIEPDVSTVELEIQILVLKTLPLSANTLVLLTRTTDGRGALIITFLLDTFSGQYGLLSGSGFDQPTPNYKLLISKNVEICQPAWQTFFSCCTEDCDSPWQIK